MRRFKIWFKNLKFRNKILIICLLASLLPVIALGYFCYYQIQHLLITRENEVLEESLNQSILSLDYKVNTYFNVVNQIAWDEDVKRGVTSDYANSYEMYLMYRDILDPLILTARNLQNDINTITIYSNNKTIYYHGDILRPLSDIEHTSWYPSVLNTTSPKLVASDSDQTLKVVCQIFDRYNKNIVYLDIDYKHVFDSMASLFEDTYGIIIFDENNQPVYSFESFSKQNNSYKLSADELLKKYKNGSLDQDYVYKKAALSSYKWTAYLYRPLGTVSASTSQITVTVIFVIFLCILFLFLSIYFLSIIVVRPLEKLAKNMEQIEKGDFSVTVINTSTDEIGHLIRQFGNMVHKLQTMIDEVYNSKIAQQEYEMKALQAQINPHFFYNSLSLINSKAIMTEQEDISKMAQLLSTYYRTTLNKGKNIISVKDELENTTSYIQIQRMMHSNSFDVHFEIDEQILNYTMINLLLQPLVENAINHGIDHKETPGKGILTISGKQSDDNLIFTVADNGCGISRETLETILITKTKGYGIQNVHHRIQLNYGEKYGLFYKSKWMEGTIVTLIIPKK
ncbi:sensor histidine kinase [Niallia sp. NCCP-28]|uniref:sensor histidine kinase n=1 Tax=Niallia sp. NCCP-28 TaxID=2934712 RepID=UPI00208C0341|nr:sensor histidine kinase [Niallia sp. NCCP-28]GKU81987.1 histidine kinase [Niallia sp. NCCP-28]